MPESVLTFPDFQSKLTALFPDAPDSTPSRLERYSLSIALGGASIALLANALAAKTLLGAILLLSGLSAELLFGAIGVYLSVKRTSKELGFSDTAGAADFETDFDGYVEIVAWLRTFSSEQLKSRLAFISNRSEGWQRAASFIWGGVEKLGVLPIIVAIYLQFKDASLTWPPDVPAVGTVVAIIAIAFYTLGFWAYARKLQATRFERFLVLALNPDFKIGARQSE